MASMCRPGKPIIEIMLLLLIYILLLFAGIFIVLIASSKMLGV
jgi:ABC-type uncharacterized transport system permease subunit